MLHYEYLEYSELCDRSGCQRCLLLPALHLPASPRPLAIKGAADQLKASRYAPFADCGQSRQIRKIVSLVAAEVMIDCSGISTPTETVADTFSASHYTVDLSWAPSAAAGARAVRDQTRVVLSQTQLDLIKTPCIRLRVQGRHVLLLHDGSRRYEQPRNRLSISLSISDIRVLISLEKTIVQSFHCYPARETLF